MAFFTQGKMAYIKKITETQMLSRFKSGTILLPPLIVRGYMELRGTRDYADARIEVGLPGETAGAWFVVEAKSRSTPQVIQAAVARAKAAAQQSEELPMIQVPYLSSERLAELEQEMVSGVDLCGNGVVIVPGRLYVVRSGQPNQYRDTRALSNPYRGRSALVGRMLMSRPTWHSLNKLRQAIQEAGATLSLAQTSKSVQAMEEDLIVSKGAGSIALRDPLRLLDKLGSEWSKPRIRARKAFRLPAGADWARDLSSNNALKWVVAGESSVSQYVTFSQGGPRKIAVSSLPLGMTLLHGSPESIPNFADIELVETEDPGFFFQHETDENGVRWASRLQEWLELQSGDARQREAANEIKTQILKRVQT
jgi:hypothetical protein